MWLIATSRKGLKTVSKFIFFNLFAAFFNLFVSFSNLYAAFFNLFVLLFSLFAALSNLFVPFFNLFVLLFSLFEVLFSVFLFKKGRWLFEKATFPTTFTGILAYMQTKNIGLSHGRYYSRSEFLMSRNDNPRFNISISPIAVQKRIRPFLMMARVTPTPAPIAKASVMN